MIDKITNREQFSLRLHQALDEAGVRRHGRGADLRSILRDSRIQKTAQAVSKWLNGSAIPEITSLSVIADHLGVRREWLEYGVPPVREGESFSQTSIIPNSHRHLDEKVPLISWAQAGRFDIRRKRHSELDAEVWLQCPISISKSGYALKLDSDSMTNFGYGKSYPVGCIIFVDPELKISNGDSVIARLPNTEDATFKILVKDAGIQYLKPLNSQYPTIVKTPETDLCGKVIGTFIPE